MDQAAIRQTLQNSATRIAGNKWTFDGGYTHTEEQALAIVESCLLLDVPVTDMFTSQAWLTLVRRLVALEQRTEPAE